jgi:transcriptional regulator with XRE-family HTH domain
MDDENDSYNADAMAGAGGRPPQKEAPAFSRRLAALRRHKGLSQTELAERMRTTQKMVDYYERRAANPALEVIQRAAAALGVAPAELIGDDGAPRTTSRKAGPTGKVQKVFEDVAKLPRRQQEKIVQVVAALVSQYEQARQ